MDFDRFPMLKGFIRAPITDESNKDFDPNLVKNLANILRNVRMKSPPTPEMIQAVFDYLNTLDTVEFDELDIYPAF